MPNFMGKSFAIIVIVVAVVAFSVSAFVFSDNNITLNLPVSTQSDDLDKQSILNEINGCIEQNLNGHMSVNSFNTNMLIGLQQEVMNAETEQTLENVRNTLYQITDCKQDNSYYLP
jgi:TRAP-type C4-dicarboxylate transport system substrate-binding protein